MNIKPYNKTLLIKENCYRIDNDLNFSIIVIYIKITCIICIFITKKLKNNCSICFNNLLVYYN